MDALCIRAEAYSNIKSSESFDWLTDRMSTLDGIITNGRKFYNDSVTLNNIKTEKFPDLSEAISYFSFRLSTVKILGTVFGISIKEVTPPAMAALVLAYRLPLCVSPGSLN